MTTLKLELSDSERESIIRDKIIPKSTEYISNIYTDLNIFNNIYDSTNKLVSKSLFDNINLTYTNIGKIKLQDILLNPIDDINTLLKRQSIIKKFIQYEIVCDEVVKQFEILNKTETSLIWFWKNLDKETIQMVQLVYFQNRFLQSYNRHDTALNILNDFNIIYSPIISILSPIIIIVIPFIFLKFLNIEIDLSFDTYLKLVSTAIDFTSAFTNNSIIKYIIKIIWYALTIHNIYNSFEIAISRYNIINTLFSRIKDVTKFVIACRKIDAIVCDNNVFDNKLKDLSIFLEMFDHECFKDDFGLFSNKGHILHSFQWFGLYKNRFIEMLNYIGKIDAYLSISKLYIKNMDSKLRFSFTNYIENDKPIIKINKLWNPILNKETVICNNYNNKKNVNIITGPNASGKSNYIKNIVISILLSQTLGISCCNNIKLTPFSLIDTYINIPDCIGRESLFEAEMNRSYKYIEKIKNNDKFSFVIMDEIFTGTNTKEGLSAAYAICKELLKYKNNITIITTHFNLLTSINNIENYKTIINRDDKNNIIYTYKIVKGISNDHIAIELLKNKGFNNDIITMANNIYSQL